MPKPQAPTTVTLRAKSGGITIVTRGHPLIWSANSLSQNVIKGPLGCLVKIWAKTINEPRHRETRRSARRRGQ
jgi:hypothetical protein